jgi:hypothetical protein
LTRPVRLLFGRLSNRRTVVCDVHGTSAGRSVNVTGSEMGTRINGE